MQPVSNYQVKLEDFVNFTEKCCMKALFFDKNPELREVADPQPQNGELLVKIRTSAICNTDLEIIKGYMGFKGVPGHEFVGEVITSGNPLSGMRVAGEINCPCGTCYLCRTNRPTHCESRTVTGILMHQGVFADYICLPAGNLHRVPENIPDEIAVFTEPLAAAVEIFDQIHIRPSEKVFIFGAGKLGLLISMLFRLYGGSATTFDIHDRKVKIAQQLGLSAAPVSSLNPGDKAEVCIDCTGSPDGFSLAMSHLWPRGTLVLKTTVATPAMADLNQIVINEFQVKGSRCGPFPPALKILADGLINPTPLITATYDFGQITEALRVAALPESMKVLISHS